MDCDTIKYFYERAIEGRKIILDEYHRWMYMFAIISGALFIGFYNISDDIFKFFICIVGCFSGFIWYFSFCGYHKWIISWINVVAYWEARLDKEYTKENAKAEIYVYRLFNSNKKPYPFSTPKLLKKLSVCIAVVWGLLAVLNILQDANIHITFLSKYCNLKIAILLAMVAATILCAIFCREHLSNKTHKLLKINSVDDFRIDDFS